ncbi:MAG: glucan 1,4-alpha-glucosidase, partial [Xanthobacteraceae bacterium]|nr:glucan 1,4-alpha-glucosidase [Xanthobacteraceae bacterium]
FKGRPSGGAMPLVWAHSEHIKLMRSLKDGRVFDMPPQTVQRYLVDKVTSPRRIWRFNEKLRSIPAGLVLRIELPAPALIHWSLDGWAATHDTPTTANAFGLHIADLPTTGAPEGRHLRFTFFWSEADKWEGADFAVAIDGDDAMFHGSQDPNAPDASRRVAEPAETTK